MSRSKKIFIFFTIIFFILLMYASYDISKRTTFPGSKSQLKVRLKKNHLNSDTIDVNNSVIKHDTLVQRNKKSKDRLLNSIFRLNLKQIKANNRHEIPFVAYLGDFQFNRVV